MHITIQNFRSYESYDVEIPDGSLTLINGTSGVGKTTIFEAIKWCLYGKLKSYAPFNKPKSKTYVCIKFDNISNIKEFTIIRQANPTNFSVVLDNKEYKHEDAMNYIIKYFGPPDVFQAASYIDQGSKNYLLDIAQTDRLDILNYLTFSNDNPALIRDQLISHINEEKKKYDKLTELNNTEIKRFEEFKLLLTESDIEILSNTTEASIKETIATSELLYQDYNDKYQKLMSIIKEYNDIHNKKLSYNKQIESISLLPDNEIASIKLDILRINDDINNCDVHLNYEKHMKLESSILSNINNLSNISELDNLNITELDYKNALNLESKYHNSLKIAKSHNLEYNKDSVANHITHLKHKLEIQPLLSTYDKLNSKLNTYTPEIKNSVADNIKDNVAKNNKEIDEIKQKLTDIARSKNIVTCPHCNGNVRLVANGDKLVLKVVSDVCVSGDNKAYEVRLTELNKLNAELNAHIIKRQNYETNKSAFDDLISSTLSKLSNIDKLPRLSKADLQKEITILESLEYVELPSPSSTQINNALKCMQLKSELAKLQSVRPKACKSNGDKKQLTIEYNKLVKIVDLHKENKIKVAHIKSLLDQLPVIDKPNISEIDELKSLINTTKSTIESYKSLLNKYKLYQQLVKYSEDIEKRYDDIESVVQRHTTFKEIKNIATKIENNTLAQTVATINNVLAKVVNSLFDDEIEVVLRLHRQLKTRDTVKPEVGLSITYHGVEYTSPTQLSGGELNRVSIALVIALAHVNLSPILLLDEALSFLDSDHREKVIDIIKLISKDKTVIIISHEEVVGRYDNVIHICR